VGKPGILFCGAAQQVGAVNGGEARPHDLLTRAGVMAVSWTEATIERENGLGMAARIYRASPSARSAPLVLHLHGGAFVVGSLENGETVATLLADAGAVVVSIDYPLAPRHRFPQPLHAAFQALNWLQAHRAGLAGKKSGLFVAGEEAGGNLAAALGLMARDQQAPPLAGQILLSPMLDPCMATCSVRQAEAGPVGCQWADGWHQYLGSPDKAAHPYASPLGSSRLAGLAPALLLTAEDDLMRDENLSYARRLRESGVHVREHVLTAPTQWPCALSHPSSMEPAWAATVRHHFSVFFAEVVASRRPQSSFQSTHMQGVLS
jgi:acetyl esterase/lipase